MKSKKGISLIVLVITIIVMIILASAIIMSLDNTNIFNKAEEAVEKTNGKTNKYLSELKLAERELEKIQGASKVTDTTPGELSGKGTTEEPYLIESIDDLVAFSNEVNGGRTFEGQTVKLTRLLDFNSDNSYVDLSLKQTLTDLNEIGFTPIGTEDNPFMGTFDGDGVEIRNIYINSAEDYIGFFGVIRNANIYNIGITGNIVSNGMSAGGIVGFANNTKETKIANCYNKIKVDNNHDEACDAAGIVSFVSHYQLGDFELIIEDCYNLGIITATEGDAYSAGIVGYVEPANKVRINKCYNSGKISGIYAGGIIGEGNTYTTIINVYNEGEIYTSKYYAGGIGATIAWCNIENAYNAGKIILSDSAMYAGGIVSNSVGNVIHNCFNMGDMTISSRFGEIIGDTTGGTDNNSVSYLYYLKNRNNMLSHKGNSEVIDSTPTGVTLNKSLEEMKSQSFVEELNSNIQGRDDLVKWKMGPKGYPTLDI